MEIVLLGHMGRDEAVVDRLEGHRLHILGQWRNPGLVEKAEASGGQFQVIDSIKNVTAVADFVESVEPDMFLTNFDDSLAAGVVDFIKQRIADKRIPDLWIPSPDQASSRVEWDKFYLRELVNEINPSYNPINFMIKTSVEVAGAIDYFKVKNKEIAVKPRNLTGGKGVKVMGKQLDTFDDANAYALQVLATDNQDGVEIQEKLEGHEFTLQLFTDGLTLVRPPATYDYPYREDGDKGPGTGGMGTFSMKDGRLPFVTEIDYNEALTLMEQLLVKMKERGHDYKGVLYPTFFKTSDGLKIVEVNARGGDPELINIVDLINDDVDLAEVLKLIALGELTSDSVRYKRLASAMLYLVSPEYSYSSGPQYDFVMDTSIIKALGCRIRFAAAERVGNNNYQTVGSSRSVGLSALGDNPWDARELIHNAIKAGFEMPMPLQYRNQIGQEEYIKELGLAA